MAGCYLNKGHSVVDQCTRVSCCSTDDTGRSAIYFDDTLGLKIYVTRDIEQKDV